MRHARVAYEDLRILPRDGIVEELMDDEIQLTGHDAVKEESSSYDHLDIKDATNYDSNTYTTNNRTDDEHTMTQ